MKKLIIVILLFFLACSSSISQKARLKNPTSIKLKKGTIEWNSLGRADVVDTYAIELDQGRTYDIELHRDVDGDLKQSLDLYLTDPQGQRLKIGKTKEDRGVAVGKVSPGIDGIYYLEIKINTELPTAKIYGIGYSEDDSS